MQRAPDEALGAYSRIEDSDYPTAQNPLRGKGWTVLGLFLTCGPFGPKLHEKDRPGACSTRTPRVRRLTIGM